MDLFTYYLVNYFSPYLLHIVIAQSDVLKGKTTLFNKKSAEAYQILYKHARGSRTAVRSVTKFLSIELKDTFLNLY